VIRSFRNDVTADLFYGAPSSKLRKVPPDVIRTAQRKLAMVDAATDLADLRVPPANRLEALKGDGKGYHSIRVNDQWRIVFRWDSDGAHDVVFTDYH
jgi:toxin HigB-1